MGRRESREAAVRIVFQNGFLDKTPEELVNLYIEDMDEDFGGDVKDAAELDTEYLKDVVTGAIAHKEEACELINKTAKGWTVERMARTDVAVLLVAYYEVFYKEDVPDSVAINEAIDIARKYNNDDAGSFINGILGTIYRMKKGGEQEEK